MSEDPTQSTTEASDDEFPPAKRLEAPSVRLIDAGIATITDMETLHACVAYENQHQQRLPVLKQLARRAEELREEDEP
ncbi:hypothetical protein [Saliphagus sp. LR7]|uniref:hypothetical protein n=1 Tax=Saliphagus sp. LR7 TaxID=2282654 RepID=UPI000DF7EEE1|nr:hypothetical protein [Saliphagus sp. LR7]